MCNQWVQQPSPRATKVQLTNQDPSERHGWESWRQWCWLAQRHKMKRCHGLHPRNDQLEALCVLMSGEKQKPWINKRGGLEEEENVKRKQRGHQRENRAQRYRDGLHQPLVPSRPGSRVTPVTPWDFCLFLLHELNRKPPYALASLNGAVLFYNLNKLKQHRRESGNNLGEASTLIQRKQSHLLKHLSIFKKLPIIWEEKLSY